MRCLHFLVLSKTGSGYWVLCDWHTFLKKVCCCSRSRFVWFITHGVSSVLGLIYCFLTCSWSVQQDTGVRMCKTGWARCSWWSKTHALTHRYGWGMQVWVTAAGWQSKLRDQSTRLPIVFSEAVEHTLSTWEGVSVLRNYSSRIVDRNQSLNVLEPIHRWTFLRNIVFTSSRSWNIF